jgi:hypothetical protein
MTGRSWVRNISSGLDLIRDTAAAEMFKVSE